MLRILLILHVLFYAFTAANSGVYNPFAWATITAIAAQDFGYKSDLQLVIGIELIFMVIAVTISYYIKLEKTQR